MIQQFGDGISSILIQLLKMMPELRSIFISILINFKFKLTITNYIQNFYTFSLDFHYNSKFEMHY